MQRAAAPPVQTELQRRVMQRAAQRKPRPPRGRRRPTRSPRSRCRSAKRFNEPPSLSLLTSPDTIQRHHLSDEALEENARMLDKRAR